VSRGGRSLPPPREFFAAGQWPRGAGQPDAPLDAGVAQRLVVALLDACAGDGRPLDRLCAQAAVDYVEFLDVLAGSSYPEFVVIASFEDVLGVALWRPSGPPAT
jgi:hypothetical protein